MPLNVLKKLSIARLEMSTNCFNYFNWLKDSRSSFMVIKWNKNSIFHPTVHFMSPQINYQQWRSRERTLFPLVSETHWKVKYFSSINFDASIYTSLFWFFYNTTHNLRWQRRAWECRRKIAKASWIIVIAMNLHFFLI
jgi:hypothetical protein